MKKIMSELKEIEQLSKGGYQKGVITDFQILKQE